MAESAILGGSPIAKDAVVPAWPMSDETERDAVLDVLTSGSWYNGDRVKEFEDSFAAMQDAKYGIATTGGTVALEAIVRAAGLGIGDEIITSSYTFIGTCTAILKTGVAIRFVDIDPDTNNLDINQIEDAVTSHTRAIMPVHYGGLACDIDRLLLICDKHDLIMLEDACHSWGSKYRAKGLGRWGTAGAFSFQQSKNITCGDGGIALTDDEAVADAIGCAVNQGRSRYGKADPRLQWGSNHRMTEFSAALLLAQMNRLPDQVEVREHNAAMLTRTIGHIEGLESCDRLPDATVVSWHVYGGRYLAEQWDGMPRGIFVQAMQAEGVKLGTGYAQPVYREIVFQQDWADSKDIRPFAWAGEDWVQDYRSLNLPKVEAYCEERIGIRHAGLLVDEQAMKQVCDAFTKVSENRGELIAAWRAGRF